MTTRPPRPLPAPLVAALLALVVGCLSSPTPFEGLAAARDTGGPRVRFDLRGDPQADQPFPNDLLTRTDPRSPTGRRLDLSLRAPGALEEGLRAQLDQLDGFGTFAPISVPFDAPLDVLDLWARQNNADPDDDAVLLVDLATGGRVPLDVGSGRFPAETVGAAPLFLADPFAAATNLLFPVDGPHANLLHAPDPGWAAAHGGVPQATDDLLTFFERSTNTLVVRPVLPLAQRRAYAVVLTDRLVGTDGRAVRSPFAGVNHALQTGQLEPLRKALGAQLSHVAFAWAFTTQGTTRDLELIREGLYARGPYAGLYARFPVQQGVSGASGENAYVTLLDLLPLSDNDVSPTPHLFSGERLSELVRDPVAAGLLGATPEEAAAIAEELTWVDYLVAGQFEVPDLLWDPDRAPAEAAFQLDERTGFARGRPAQVPVIIAVPKRDPRLFREPPFPAVLLGHGLGGSRLQSLLGWAGSFARQGLASVAIDAPGCGPRLPSDPTERAAARSAFAAHGAGRFFDALAQTRAADLDNDGYADACAGLWSTNPFHVRDVLRQAVVEQLQLARLLRTFDANGYMLLPGQRVNLAGDFDDDGIPDLAGPPAWPQDVAVLGTTVFKKGDSNPGSHLFAFGSSLGAFASALLPAVEPSVRAGVAAGGGGGLADVVARSADAALRAGMLLGAAGPLVATCDWSASDERCGGAAAEPALVWSVERAGREAALPIARLALQPGEAVTACNLTRLEGLVPSDEALAAGTNPACTRAVADGAGHLRLGLGAARPELFVSRTASATAGQPDVVSVTTLRAGDRVRLLVTRASGAVLPIDAWGWSVVHDGVTYPRGSPLRAPAGGLGRERNTPAMRRWLQLVQTALEPADPVNYAAAWSSAPLAVRNGLPANVLVVASAGDPVVPVSAGVALARAAGLVPFGAPDPAWGLSIDEVLVRSAALEGAARLPRFSSPAAGPLGALGAHLACAPGACPGGGLADVSGLACDAAGGACADGLLAPRLSPPLREALQRTARSSDGNPIGVSGLLLPLFDRAGAHGVGFPRPSRAFDVDRYLLNLSARYFETRGRELPLDPCLARPGACSWNDFPPPE